MAQQGQQYAHEKLRPQHAPPNAAPPPHDHHGMKPWLQRTIIGLSVTLSVSGITAFTSIILENQKSVARVEAKLDDLASDFDRFVDLRYVKDIDDLEDQVAAMDDRLERLRDSMMTGG